MSELRSKLFGARVTEKEFVEIESAKKLIKISAADWFLLCSRVHKKNPDLFRSEWLAWMDEKL